MGGAASSSRVHIRNSQEEELLETKALNGKAKRDINDVSKQDNNKATRKALASKNTAKEQNGLSSESETTNLKLEEETEVNTDEILKSRGFDDPVLATYCKETPTLLNSFIKIYEHVENIKDKLEEEDVISAVNKYFKGISLAYSGKKSFRIIKGNFLAELGFADVYKDVIDRLLPKYPNMLTLVKLESDDDKVEKMVSIIIYLLIYCIYLNVGYFRCIYYFSFRKANTFSDHKTTKIIKHDLIIFSSEFAKINCFF